MFSYCNLFSADLSNDFSSRVSQALGYIQSQKDDYILNCDFDELVNYITNKYKVEEIYISNEPSYEWVEPDNGNTQYILKCKYVISSGKESIVYRPSSYSFSLGGRDGIPDLEFDHNLNALCLIFKKAFSLKRIEELTESGSINNSYFNEVFSYDSKMFFGNIANLSAEIKNKNDALRSRIVSSLSDRYSIANRKVSLRNSLKISTMPISDIRNKKVEIKMIQKEAKRPEANVEEPYYYISNDDYDLIIQIINRCMIQYERTSATFKVLGEEDIRNIILGAINANFNFSGTAESFSNKGHTDIMIDVSNKAAFIAECKLWKGQAYVSAGIDQLLNYATYKDGKLALLIFNKDNKDYDNVLKEVERLIENNPNKITKIYCKNNIFQYKFFSKTNCNSVTITFIVANYYN